MTGIPVEVIRVAPGDLEYCQCLLLDRLTSSAHIGSSHRDCVSPENAPELSLLSVRIGGSA